MVLDLHRGAFPASPAPVLLDTVFFPSPSTIGTRLSTTELRHAGEHRPEAPIGTSARPALPGIAPQRPRLGAEAFRSQADFLRRAKAALIRGSDHDPAPREAIRREFCGAGAPMVMYGTAGPKDESVVQNAPRNMRSPPAITTKVVPRIDGWGKRLRATDVRVIVPLTASRAWMSFSENKGDFSN